MEQPQRLILRFELHGDAPVNLDDVIPVFHGWIQNGRLSTMLIDVADYKHVEASPGVVLIGHTDDCGIDNGLPRTESGQGFHYTRKHARLADEASFLERLRQLWTNALEAAEALEQEAGLGVSINPGRLQLMVPDRLRYAFTEANVQAVAALVQEWLAEVFGSAAVTVSHPGIDERLPLTLTVAVAGEHSVASVQASGN
ncbi:MAG: hypothetical protein F4Y37_09410 [Caldilineaceae bacterium SB0664_bin_22]|nr:hypothetical protein [Caldilineaceae bacterium SB0664_bin_22]MYC64251.1 hypothetical protein [Caldilineaceae bacterium SB0661_bin_34]